MKTGSFKIAGSTRYNYNSINVNMQETRKYNIFIGIEEIKINFIFAI